MTLKTVRMAVYLALAAALLLVPMACSDDDDFDGGVTDARADGVSKTDAKKTGLPKDYKPYACTKPGKSCNAHDACAVHPVCGTDKKCWPQFLMDCDDGLSCTLDSCAGLGLCNNAPTKGYCVVGVSTTDDAGTPSTTFKCVTKGTKKPGDPCLACAPTESDGGISDNKKWMPITGGACDDKSACTKNDACVNGNCKGTYYGNLCSDGIGCTIDKCDGTGGCLGNTLKTDYCLISGTCYKDNAKHPSGSCYECDVTKSQSAWTPITNTCLIGGKCYNQADYNTGKCAQCITATSTTSWTVTTTNCLINNICKKPNDLDDIKCAKCDPAKNKYGWTPLAGVCKIGGKCYNKGDKHPGSCAECDPAVSSTAWTVKGSYCLINNVCKNPKDKDAIKCGTCDPTKDKYTWTPIAGLCKISGACYNKNDKHLGGCAICDPAKSSTTWTVNTNNCLIYNVCKKPNDKDLSGCASCVPTKSKYAWSALPGLCKIDGKCYSKGAKHPQGCASCDPTKSTTAWTASTGCVIEGKCYAKGAKDPTGCGACDPNKNKNNWSVAGNSCLVGGQCFSNGTMEPGGCGVCKPLTSKTSWTKPKGCDGAYLWSKSFGDKSSDYGYGIGADANGNVYVAGYFYGSSSSSYPGVNFGGATHKSNGSYDMYIASFSPSGQYRWSKSFGSTSSDYVYDLAVDNAGNVYITGYFYNSVNFGGTTIYSKGSGDVFLASFTSDGKHRWSKGFGDKSSDYGYAVTTDSAGNVYLSGHYYGSSSSSYPGINFGGGTLKSKGGNDVFIASFTSAGKHRWSKSFGNTSYDYGYGVAADAAGNVYITGYFYSSVNFGGGTIYSKGSGDIFLASFNSAGTHRWSKGFGDASSDYGYGVAVDASGNVYITGYFYGYTSSSYKGVNFGGSTLKSKGYGDVYVASFTSGGAHRWSKNWGSTQYDYGYAITTDKSSNVYVAGAAYSGINFGGGTLANKGGYDVFVASFTSGGQYRWARSHGDVSSDYGRKIACDAQGNVLTTGYYYSSTSTSYKGISFGGKIHKGKGSSEGFVFKVKQ